MWVMIETSSVRNGELGPQDFRVRTCGWNSRSRRDFAFASWWDGEISLRVELVQHRLVSFHMNWCSKNLQFLPILGFSTFWIFYTGLYHSLCCICPYFWVFVLLSEFCWVRQGLNCLSFDINAPSFSKHSLNDPPTNRGPPSLPRRLMNMLFVPQAWPPTFLTTARYSSCWDKFQAFDEKITPVIHRNTTMGINLSPGAFTH